MKYIGINLIKHVQYLYTENYKTLKKGNKDLSKWEDMTISMILKTQCSKDVDHPPTDL